MSFGNDVADDGAFFGVVYDDGLAGVADAFEDGVMKTCQVLTPDLTGFTGHNGPHKPPRGFGVSATKLTPMRVWPPICARVARSGAARC
ncbi:MAG: hypothetical protein U9R15_04660 [Chloroflexota bacterium]|nr:hypothetical protein [Chloroflexota bacterium]